MRHCFLFAASLLGACAVEPTATPEPTAEVDFTIRGRVTEPTVTHVVAISELDHVVTRVVAPVRGGAFALAVSPGRPWLIAFVDDTRIGRAKTVGVLRAGTLDTLVAAAPGEIELGAIHFAVGTATAELDDASVIAGLGLDETTAATLGDCDDFATRYANVDLDGDGVLDAYQDGFAARLDVHTDLRLSSHGHPPTIDDLISGDMAMTYVGAAITARMPDRFGAIDPEASSVTFDAPFYGVAAGAETPVVAPGVAITGAALVMGTDHNFGVFGRGDHRLPAGRYRFAVPGGSLEFTDVRTTTDPEVAPFVRLAMPAACAAMACVPDALRFAWRRHTDDGWVPVTDGEVATLQPAASIKILQTGAMGVTYRTFDLPVGAATGSLPWDGSTTLYTTAAAAQPAGDVVFMAVRFGIALGVDGDASFAVTPLQGQRRAAR